MTQAPHPSPEAPFEPSSETFSAAAATGRRPRRLLGVGFWVAIAIIVACILAAIGVRLYGPLLFAPAHHLDAVPSASAQATGESPADVAVDAGASAAQHAAQNAAQPSDTVIFALRQRVADLETRQQQQAAAAAAALAASALDHATQTSGPFTQELAAIEPLLSATTDLRVLHRLAETGAPTRATLAKTFPAVAARAAAAARAPTDGSGWLANAAHALSSIITVRRIDQTSGNGPDAILARAEARIDDGDMEGALKDLSKLPPAAQEAMAPWRQGLERRAEIDRRISAIRALALHDLSRAALEGRAQ